MEYNYHKNTGQLAFIKFVKSLVHLLIRPKVEWKDENRLVYPNLPQYSR